MLTVRNLEANQTDEEERGNVGELVPNKLEVIMETHDGGVLDRRRLVT